MRKIALVLATAMLLAGLAACDDRECLHGHTQTTTTMVFTGKTTVPVVSTTYVCDEYAPEDPAQ